MARARNEVNVAITLGAIVSLYGGRFCGAKAPPGGVSRPVDMM